MEDIAHAVLKEKRFGFEEVAYLLLSNPIADKELSSFSELINENMPLEQKTKMNIIELEGNNIMNILAQSVLEMYRFDPDADDTSRDNLMGRVSNLFRNSLPLLLMLSTCFVTLLWGGSLHIRHPREKLSLQRISYICSKKILRNWMPVHSIYCLFFKRSMEEVITLRSQSV